MALRAFIKRSVQAGRSALERRRRLASIEFSKNISYEKNQICTYNKDYGRIQSQWNKLMNTDFLDQETVLCGKFCDEDSVNAAKFAEECIVTSEKFAEEDTINAEKMADEGAIGCAKFAVDEIARAEKMNIEFVRILKSSQIPTWSHDYQLILEAVNKDSGEKSLYYAEVQSQLWTEEKPYKLVTWMPE